MKIAVLSDIHANHGALSAVLAHVAEHYGADVRFLQLGDLVNYGPRPNEVVDAIRGLTDAGRVLVNLAGNHEAALLGIENDRFSTQRGRDALRFTTGVIRDDNHAFLRDRLSYEPVGFQLDGRNLLCVHGSLADKFWCCLRGTELASPAYRPWDLVFCGHTHLPLSYEEFFVDANQARRDRRKTVFVNPGSVGQPRNHDPRAQYLAWDATADEYHFHKVAYDIAAERACFTAGLDAFYRDRLIQGV